MQSGIVIGLIEDDPVQAELFSAMIVAGGMQVRAYATVQEFRRRNGADSIDVLLLDWNLPGVSGIELLKSMQMLPAPRPPVLLLTGKGEERDIVYGLQCGADDYIVKPPRAAELAARVKVAHRRAHPGHGTTIPGVAPFEFDMRERVATLHGRALDLTEREFDLLAFLFLRADRVVSREMLLTEVWKLPNSSSTRSIDTYVSRLRRKAGLCGESGWNLNSIYQTGYRLARTPGRSGPEMNKSFR